ncbi:hypothetical protein HJB51_27450 [Rhizobium lentis]|uniref:hypothetical protein n=1 Tax=Rhizobium lentis TaxID=1138194 RepID=UPI001C8320D3|nr:hypothetical protein [Rhizobium lentis]MBX4976211.1 hypothetical protein [Rhizobium lentis]MBX5044275.1 hypothetical protein [Rhizobium lentis]MBX5056782.1 hypothetical protein [Rhizobium lentis]MBX5074403.1 hypothetical protein [Rhizobium lentis]MBX5111675.1 hypothetical protein [Rhizobium lentis]
MSNMTLKDWRSRVPHLVRQGNRERKHRRLMDGAMVFATVLSACATAFTGALAVFQYQASRDALIAADRNRAFEALFDALRPACEKVQTTAIVLRINPVISKHTPLEDYKRQSSMLTDELNPLIPAILEKYSKFGIWAKSSEAYGFREIFDRYVTPLHTLYTDSYHEVFPEAEGERIKAFERGVYTAAFYCSSMDSELISWFRDGTKFSAKLDGPPPVPKTGIPDIFFQLKLNQP